MTAPQSLFPPIEIPHVMTRIHYERMLRELLAEQKSTENEKS